MNLENRHKNCENYNESIGLCMIRSERAICKKLSKYGERFNLIYHIHEELFQLSDSQGSPMLAIYSKDNPNRAVHAWETLEKLYEERCNLQVQLNLVREERNKYYRKALETTKELRKIQLHENILNN